MAQPTSGVTAFNPSLTDLTLEAFSRILLRSTSITQEHMFQARMSANLLFSKWSNRQVNLFKVQLLSFALVPGVASYTLPTNIIAMLDVYIREFQLTGPLNAVPEFTTVANSNLVNVMVPNNGMAVGAWCSIIIPVAVGGIVLQGQYQAVSITDANNFTITAASTATSGVTGGAVPIFNTEQGSALVTVTLPNHGLAPQQSFAVQVSTAVGGITLLGAYTVYSVTDANDFVISTPFIAGVAAQATENGALCQVAPQSPTAQPLDFYLYPISRTEYAAQPDKESQARPTTFWFDRLVPPVLTFWQTPDSNGPYTLYYYAVV